ncbi:hypothetical protein J3R82DRAFT_3818 [Butyriboletus roseoflavus]|nr:hypothetical protein J3R82DRAFT_3818 [Butyriboletus roseoflavus]
MSSSMQHIVNAANADIADILTVKETIRSVTGHADAIPLLSIASDIQLANYQNDRWPNWNAILTHDISSQPDHPWLQIGRAVNSPGKDPSGSGSRPPTLKAVASSPVEKATPEMPNMKEFQDD